MGLLINLYWLCLGIGGLYILVAGSLGAIGAAGHGGGGDVSSGHDVGGDAGGHEMGALPSGHDASGDAAHDVGGGHDASGDTADDAAHGATIADHAPHVGATDALDQPSPFSLLNLMCFLASFGGTGVALLASGFPHLLSFPLALVGGVGVTALFHFGVTRLLYAMQGGSAPTQYDILGLEAEVITPLEEGHLGEIAYVVGGQRYTAPARLMEAGRAGRKDPVRIVKVEGSTVYVEPWRRLLD